MTNLIMRNSTIGALLLGLLLMWPVIGNAQEARKGMLVLGSANKATLVERVEIAAELYRDQPDFDYIIVSGGCGAHNSSICEATEMFQRLVREGVPAEKIHKEEKSKTTVQNYVYSRKLRNLRGEKLIQPGDQLVVVSNHWHAMSVAARLSEHDGVNAEYHIKGNIKPRKDDKADYSNIYDNELETEAYGLRGAWPKTDYSFSTQTDKRADRSAYMVVGPYVYSQSTEITRAVGPIDFGVAVEEPDAAYYEDSKDRVYFLIADRVIFGRYGKDLKEVALKDHFNELPEPFAYGHFDAAFFHPRSREVYLFKADEVLRVSRKGKVVEQPKKIREWIQDWPFAWGSGDLDAAHYDHLAQKLKLFRGQEVMEVSLDDQPVITEGPTRLSLERPEEL